MNWFKRSKAEISEKELNSKLKELIKNDSFFQKLFAKFHVPLEYIDDNLNFKIDEIDGKNAISDSNSITFNKSLFDKYNFLTDGIHFVAHEVAHWLQRQRENNMYLADSEEIEAFSVGIAYEVGRGRTDDEIRSIYYPIILDHVLNERDGKIMMNSLITDAKKRLKELRDEQ